jgi:hypothetical protein
MKTSLAIATAALMFSAILSLTGVAVACYDSLSPKGPPGGACATQQHQPTGPNRGR